MDATPVPTVLDPADGGEEIVTAGNRIGHKVPHLVVDGIDERDIFAFAPTMICDRVHWDTVDDFDARQLVGELGMEAYTRQWSDGQPRAAAYTPLKLPTIYPA